VLQLLSEVGHLLTKILEALRQVGRRSLTSRRRSSTADLREGVYPDVDRPCLVMFGLELATADPASYGVYRDP
jgi:hypothetical protein